MIQNNSLSLRLQHCPDDCVERVEGDKGSLLSPRPVHPKGVIDTTNQDVIPDPSVFQICRAPFAPFRRGSVRDHREKVVALTAL